MKGGFWRRIVELWTPPKVTTKKIAVAGTFNRKLTSCAAPLTAFKIEIAIHSILTPDRTDESCSIANFSHHPLFVSPVISPFLTRKSYDVSRDLSVCGKQESELDIPSGMVSGERRGHHTNEIYNYSRVSQKTCKNNNSRSKILKMMHFLLHHPTNPPDVTAFLNPRILL